MKTRNIKVHSYNTVVVGTGAAGFNAADRLYQYGQTDIAMVTDGLTNGTSRNTGSDKQTYYKLTLSGGDADSVREMARTLYAGGCVDGDIALCEAALSAQGFLRLVELGVPFPRNRYGEYIGYKTDHDPRRRATSVGPYTSKMMTECLEKSVMQKDIRIHNGMLAIQILVEDGKVCGLLCLDTHNPNDENGRFVAFKCRNIVWATGGPAGMYANSAYPPGHYGATGTAFAAGAAGRNLTEWQFGLASLCPRWNVSGTYMQVLPRFISAQPDGTDEREFLYDFFTDEGALLTNVFLKGYQWPFDVRKVAGGSSIIDVLVYLEGKKGRRVFLDFRQNPRGRDIDYGSLSAEAREYLAGAGACFGTPIERLLHMNTPAVDFYRDKGVDLASQPLEIALCAQHNNGGIAVDSWWQTGVQGLFAAGESAASHGVYRPGGSALNAGQVGSTRAAQYITARCPGGPSGAAFAAALDAAASAADALCKKALCGHSNLSEIWRACTKRMSEDGGAMRNAEKVKAALDEVGALRASFADVVKIASAGELGRFFRLRDILTAQFVYLSAMLDYIASGGKSRGSALYYDPAGIKPYAELPDEFTYSLPGKDAESRLQEVWLSAEGCVFEWRAARPLPEDDDFFENVWREYRQNQNIY